MQILGKLIPVISSITTILMFGAFALVVFAILSALLRKQFNPATQRNLLAIMAVALMAFLLHALIQAKNPDYRLHISVLDKQGRVYEDCILTANVRAVPSRTQNGWDFDIPQSALPSDHAVRIYGRSRDGFMTGEIGITLSPNDHVPSASLRLIEDESGTLGGIVTDSGGHGLKGVRVFVVGRAGQADTDDSGRFLISPHLAEGQEVQLHAELSGYEPKTQTHWIGKVPCYIVLKRRR
jgi:hypothetical protein